MLPVMDFFSLRPLALLALSWHACGSAFSQAVVKPPAAAAKVEAGLELAVNWKWRVAPPEKLEWGMPLPAALVPQTPGTRALEPGTPAAVRPEIYEVKKGDAIIKIAKKFGMTAAQLKQFNELKDDLIRVGQVLRIPTPEQLLTLAPPPPPPPPKKQVAGKKKPGKAARVPAPAPAPEPEPEAEPASASGPGVAVARGLEDVLLAVFLDREMFSPGAIGSKSGAMLLKICQIYQDTHADAADPEMLKAKAAAALPQPYTRYSLRADDFKFIKPPVAEPVVGGSGGAATSAKKKNSKAGTPAPAPPPVTLDALVAADFLGYTSAWEFVAERFHCDEGFLRRINPDLDKVPAVGAEFLVPNVIPFEIETALEPPLQPAADPRQPVTAAVVESSRLEISRAGKLIAVMPLASARPGLRGRGCWTVLDAIAQPRLATLREARELPKQQPAAAGDENSGAQPVSTPPLENEQYIAPGPNNPVGVIWINLAKSGSTDPLPYGLHGTSIPARMSTVQGIGGLRLANWDIARATRLMPAGTALQWKAR
jgi:LysM repeat protein